MSKLHKMGAEPSFCWPLVKGPYFSKLPVFSSRSRLLPRRLDEVLRAAAFPVCAVPRPGSHESSSKQQFQSSSIDINDSPARAATIAFTATRVTRMLQCSNYEAGWHRRQGQEQQTMVIVRVHVRSKRILVTAMMMAGITMMFQ